MTMRKPIFLSRLIRVLFQNVLFYVEEDDLKHHTKGGYSNGKKTNEQKEDCKKSEEVNQGS